MAESVLGIDGKVAIVTGGGHGIGKATALLLAKGGARVVVAEINAESGVATQKEITRAGGQAIAVQTDTRVPEQVNRVVETALGRFGQLDIGVNVVGGSAGFKRILETEANVFQSVFDLNVVSTLLCSQAYIRAMARGKRGGAIVNVAALAATHAPLGLAAYGVAKAGVKNLTQSLAVEFAPQKIRVNAVAPGFIGSSTDGWMTTSEGKRLMERSVPLGRGGEPEDIAGVIVGLASPLFSYVTGEMIVVDGGHLAPLPLMADPDWQQMFQEWSSARSRRATASAGASASRRTATKKRAAR